MTVRLILKPPHDQTKRTNQDDQLGCKAHFFCESSAASRKVGGGQWLPQKPAVWPPHCSRSPGVVSGPARYVGPPRAQLIKRGTVMVHYKVHIWL